jgi:hypothetical protein
MKELRQTAVIARGVSHNDTTSVQTGGVRAYTVRRSFPRGHDYVSHPLINGNDLSPPVGAGGDRASSARLLLRSSKPRGHRPRLQVGQPHALKKLPANSSKLPAPLSSLPGRARIFCYKEMTQLNRIETKADKVMFPCTCERLLCVPVWRLEACLSQAAGPSTISAFPL